MLIRDAFLHFFEQGFDFLELVAITGPVALFE